MKKILLMCFAVVAMMFTSLAGAQDVRTYIHPRAVPLQSVIKEQASIYAPGLKYPWMMAAIIDHETCPGYKSAKCWSTNAELRNSREQGLGLPQMTRTWNADGSVRFDNMKNLREKYPAALGELDWDTFRGHPELQVRSGLVLLYEEYRRLNTITSEDERNNMTRSAYNGGGGRVSQARQRCKLAANCNPQLWYNNVELHLPQSRVKIPNYGNRSPYEINTHYVKDTGLRMNKFKQFYE